MSVFFKKPGKYKKTSLIFSLIFVAVVMRFFVMPHVVQAWPGGFPVCPNSIFDDGFGTSYTSGPNDGRCHKADLGPGSAATNSTTTPSGFTKNTTVHRGDVLKFNFDATSTVPSPVTAPMPSETLINWVTITGTPSLRNNIVAGSVVGGRVSAQPNCMMGRDNYTDDTRVYNCGQAAGVTIYSFQNLAANAGGSDGLNFNIRIPDDALDGGTGCIRFHTSLSNIGKTNPIGQNPQNVDQLIANQAIGYITKSNRDLDVNPVYAVSTLYCYTVDVPQCNPATDSSCGSFQGTSCSVAESSPISATIGQTVAVSVTYHNGSSSTDWYGGAKPSDFTPPRTPPYPGYDNSKPGGGVWQWYYPASVAASSATTDKRHVAVMFDNTNPAPATAQESTTALNNATGSTELLTHGQDSGSKTFTITSGAAGAQTYYFGILNKETGTYFASGQKLCGITINWGGGTIDYFRCDATKVSGPNTAYTLRFTRIDTITKAAVETWDLNEPAGASIDTNNTFPYFNGLSPPLPTMLPQYDYKLQLLIGASEQSNSYMTPCMRADCQDSISADFEPGQSQSVTYGVKTQNSTGQDFSSGYSVAISGTLGVSGSGSQAATLAHNSMDPGESQSATANMTATFKGDITADILYNGASILGIWHPEGCHSTIIPKTRATMKVTQGDVSAGGGFNVGNVCPGTDTTIPANKFTDGKPRFVSPLTTGGTPNSGGIRTFSNPSSKQGSGVDFAAYALGIIDGTSTGSSGFYTGGRSTVGLANFRSLIFANTVGSDAGPTLGGSLGGQLATNHCVTDYFNTTRKGTLPLQPPSGQVILGSYNTSQQLLLQKPGGQNCLRIKGGTVNAGVSLTIYTDDDVCIEGDIFYDQWHFTTSDHSNTAPYLTIISRGNIFVGSNVSTMNGLFIAQPDDADNGGAFITCSLGVSATIPSSTDIASSCRTSLTIKGSVIAQHVYPLRTVNGTLWNNTGNSETFEYIPSLIVGTPNLKRACGGAATGNCIDAENNLPPVF
jgi:hypothetical protein